MSTDLRPHVVFFCQVHLQEYGIEQGILAIVRQLAAEYQFTIMGGMTQRFRDMVAPYSVHLEDYPILPAFQPLAIHRAAQDFKRLGANLINLVDPRGSTIGAPAARWLGLPTVIEHHISPLQYNPNPLKQIGYHIGELIIGRLLTTYAPFASDNMRQVYIRRGLIAAERTLYSPVGVELENIRRGRTSPQQVRIQYHVPAEKMLFVQVGRLSPQKAPHLLLDALNQLADDPRWHVLLVGDGELRSEITARLASENLLDRVQLIGAVPHQTTLDLIAAADCLLLPSNYEFAPITLMEGLALDTPSIVTPVGDSWRMIGEGKPSPAGLCVPVGNSLALAAAIQQMLNDSTLRDRLASACSFRAQFYSQERYINDRREIYKRYLRH